MSAKQPGGMDLQIALRIRAMRVQAGMSQGELAAHLGVTFQQVQKYEKGLNRVGAGRLFEIARVFGVPVQTFFPSSDEFRNLGSEALTSRRTVREFLSGPEALKLCERYLSLTTGQRRAVSALLKDMAAGNQ